MLCCAAGNAWTDAGYDNQGAVDFWWTHALISDSIRDSLLHDCNFSGIGPLATVEYSSVDNLDKSKVEVSQPSYLIDFLCETTQQRIECYSRFGIITESTEMTALLCDCCQAVWNKLFCSRY